MREGGRSDNGGGVASEEGREELVVARETGNGGHSLTQPLKCLHREQLLQNRT